MGCWNRSCSLLREDRNDRSIGGVLGTAGSPKPRLKSSILLPPAMKCKYCKKEYTSERGRTACNSCNVTKSKIKTKIKAIQYKGGKCQECGYNKSIAALCFHHEDPREKEFGIGYKGQTFGWKKIKKEIDKCILLCQNCHHELHEKQSRKWVLLEELSWPP